MAGGAGSGRPEGAASNPSRSGGAAAAVPVIKGVVMPEVYEYQVRSPWGSWLGAPSAAPRPPLLLGSWRAATGGGRAGVGSPLRGGPAAAGPGSAGRGGGGGVWRGREKQCALLRLLPCADEGGVLFRLQLLVHYLLTALHDASAAVRGIPDKLARVQAVRVEYDIALAVHRHLLRLQSDNSMAAAAAYALEPLRWIGAVFQSLTRSALVSTVYPYSAGAAAVVEVVPLC